MKKYWVAHVAVGIEPTLGRNLPDVWHYYRSDTWAMIMCKHI
jgi:hypothetical protein